STLTVNIDEVFRDKMHPELKRNHFALYPALISGSVKPLMMVFHRGLDVESVECPDDAASDRRMCSNLVGLVLVESSRFAENGTADTDLPNVMQNGSYS